MPKEIVAKYEDLRLTDDNRIAFRVQAELLDNDSDGFAVPDVEFTIRTLAQEFRGRANRLTGIFESEDIVIDPPPLDSKDTHLTVEVVAKDSGAEIGIHVAVEISGIMKELRNKVRQLQVKLKADAETQWRKNNEKTLKEAQAERDKKSKIEDSFYEICREPHKAAKDWSFICCPENINYDLVRDFFLKRVPENEKSSEGSFAYSDTARLLKLSLSHLIEATWYDQFLEKLATNVPKFTLAEFKRYENHSHARKTVEIAAEKEHGSFFNEIKLFEFYPWAEPIALRIAEKSPMCALADFEKYKGQPWALSIRNHRCVLEAEKTAAALQDAKAKKEQKERIIKSIEVVVSFSKSPWRSNPSYADAELPDVYSSAWNEISKPENMNHDLVREVMLEFADKRIGGEIKMALLRLNKADWFGQLLEIISLNMHKLALENFGLYKDHPMAAQCVITMANNHPDDVIALFTMYESHPISQQAVEVAAENNPDAFFVNIELFEFYPWAKKIALKAAASSPKFALESFAKYKSQPWAKAVRMTAIRHK